MFLFYSLFLPLELSPLRAEMFVLHYIPSTQNRAQHREMHLSKQMHEKMCAFFKRLLRKVKNIQIRGNSLKHLRLLTSEFQQLLIQSRSCFILSTQLFSSRFLLHSLKANPRCHFICKLYVCFSLSSKNLWNLYSQSSVSNAHFLISHSH